MDFEFSAEEQAFAAEVEKLPRRARDPGRDRRPTARTSRSSSTRRSAAPS